MKEAVIRKKGNAYYLIFPPEAGKAAGMRIGDSVEVTNEKGKIVIRKIASSKKKF